MDGEQRETYVASQKCHKMLQTLTNEADVFRQDSGTELRLITAAGTIKEKNQ